MMTTTTNIEEGRAIFQGRDRARLECRRLIDERGIPWSACGWVQALASLRAELYVLRAEPWYFHAERIRAIVANIRDGARRFRSVGPHGAQAVADLFGIVRSAYTAR